MVLEFYFILFYFIPSQIVTMIMKGATWWEPRSNDCPDASALCASGNSNGAFVCVALLHRHTQSDGDFCALAAANTILARLHPEVIHTRESTASGDDFLPLGFFLSDACASGSAMAESRRKVGVSYTVRTATAPARVLGLSLSI
jgi:hypothetical protein